MTSVVVGCERCSRPICLGGSLLLCMGVAGRRETSGIIITSVAGRLTGTILTVLPSIAIDRERLSTMHLSIVELSGVLVGVLLMLVLRVLLRVL